MGGRDGSFIKDAYRSALTGRASLAISAPLLDHVTGELLGVLVAKVNMAGLDAITTDRTGLGETGETYLINKYGFMITPSRFLKDTFLRVRVDTKNARECLADMEAMRRGILFQEHEHEAMEFSDYRGVPVLGVHAHIPEMSWGLLAEIDAEEAFAPITRLRSTILALAVLLGAGALGLAYAFARRIARPIHELHIGSERIGAGELDYRLDIKTGDEIEQLADEFNRMASRLSESYASLERKVAERTADLTKEIAEREQAEEKLRASEEKFRDLTETTPDWIWEVDKDGTYVYVSPKVRELLGYEVSEVLGRTPFDFMPEEDALRVGEIFEKKAVSREPFYGLENLNLHKDGHWVVLETSGIPILDEKGQLVGYRGIDRDITARKRAEEALKNAAELWQQTFDAIEDMVIVLDRDFRVLQANRAMREAFADVEVVGASCYELIHGTNEPPPACPARHAFESGEPVEAELCEEHLGGLWLAVSTYPVKDRGGTVQKVVHVVRDVTERKRAEEQLEALNAELERSNRDLQDFTYTVSHDLQEPLRKVHTFGQFLVEDCGDRLPEESREHLRRMQDAAVRMKSLIQHLLALARVGTRGGEMASVEPRQVIARVLDTLSEQIRECAGEVTVEDPLPTVNADAVQLGEVFQNLIANALKFRSPDRVAKVAVSGRIEGDRAVFSVADNGIGIEERFLEKIFGVFQRLYPREQYEGAGVGLALCEKIIRRHGGRIWAESQPGKGSTFWFSLPLASEGTDK